MGQILHGSAKTTHVIRAAIQRSQASISELAGKYDLNPKTVRKWRKRTSIEDARMGPKSPHSTVLSPEEEAACVAFRKHTLLPLDDCLYALQASIPHLSRSSLHRLYQRHDISRLPDVKDGAEPKKKFKSYPIGYFHIHCPAVDTQYRREGTLPKCGRRKANCTCLLPSTGSASSPSWNCTTGRHAPSPVSF